MYQHLKANIKTDPFIWLIPMWPKQANKWGNMFTNWCQSEPTEKWNCLFQIDSLIWWLYPTGQKSGEIQRDITKLWQISYNVYGLVSIRTDWQMKLFAANWFVDLMVIPNWTKIRTKNEAKFKQILQKSGKYPTMFMIWCQLEPTSK